MIVKITVVNIRASLIYLGTLIIGSLMDHAHCVGSFYGARFPVNNYYNINALIK